jgi:hypothetical protein
MNSGSKPACVTPARRAARTLSEDLLNPEGLLSICSRGMGRNASRIIDAAPNRLRVFALDVTRHRDAISVLTHACQVKRYCWSATMAVAWCQAEWEEG